MKCEEALQVAKPIPFNTEEVRAIQNGMNTGLTEAEHNAVIEDINKICTTVINQLVCIADNSNIVRDDLIAYFGKIFSAMTEVSTFENWEVTE